MAKELTFEELAKVLPLHTLCALAVYCPPLAARKTVDGKTIHIVKLPSGLYSVTYPAA